MASDFGAVGSDYNGGVLKIMLIECISSSAYIDYSNHSTNRSAHNLSSLILRTKFYQ